MADFCFLQTLKSVLGSSIIHYLQWHDTLRDTSLLLRRYVPDIHLRSTLDHALKLV